MQIVVDYPCIIWIYKSRNVIKLSGCSHVDRRLMLKMQAAVDGAASYL